MKVEFVQGDITKTAMEGLVNAANPSLLGGGGVDGCIHRAAGIELLQACEEKPVMASGGRCCIGGVVVTPAFNIPVKYILHTVGPIFPAGREVLFVGELKGTESMARSMLKSCLQNCLREAQDLGLRSLAMPAISCGIYGCPMAAFAKVLKEVVKEDFDLDTLQITLFLDSEFADFVSAWEEDALREATREGRLEVVQYLVGKGADIHAWGQEQ